MVPKMTMSSFKDLEKVIQMAERQVKMTNSAAMSLVERIIPDREGVTAQEDFLKEIGISGQEENNKNQETPGRIYQGDNIRLMKEMLENETIRGKIRLIYIDPPFFSKTDYDAVVDVGKKKIHHPAYDDKWEKGIYHYLRELTARIILMKELLSEDGLIWVHLDWHAVHYVRVIMDEIFGADNFVNEIIWTYKSGGSTKRRFARKHDNILVYSKSSSYRFFPLKEKSYNRELKPYRFKGVDEYQDEIGWYTMVNMKDVWQIDMVGRTSGERTGYATQKPEQLMERILESTTREGDLTADFFCGSGTFPVVAARMGRRFIGCDHGGLAVECTLSRLFAQGSSTDVFAEQNRTDPEVQGKLPRLQATVSVSYEDIAFSNRKKMTIRIRDIRERRLSRKMDERSREIIRNAQKKNPEILIESWSIDYEYQGGIFQPDEIFTRMNGELKTEIQRETERVMENMVVKIVDVMGNSFYIRP